MQMPWQPDEQRGAPVDVVDVREVEVHRVLLVEDSPADARLLELALVSTPDTPIAIERVDRLSEAIARLDRGGIDAVLLDLGLPDSVGIATFAHLNEAHPNTPTIVLTGLEDNDVARHAVHAGAQDYVVKGSLNDRQLVRVVIHAIERRRLALAVERLATQQGVLAGLSRQALEDAPLDDLLAETCASLCRALEVSATLALERLPSGHLLVRAAAGSAEPMKGATLPALPEGHVLNDAGTLAPTVIGNVGGIWGPTQTPHESHDAVAVALWGGGFEGFLLILDPHPRRFDSDSVSFVTAIANVVSESMRRGLAERDLGERMKELSALTAVSRLTQRVRDITEIVAPTAEIVRAGMHSPDQVIVEVSVDRCSATIGGVASGMAETISAAVLVRGQQRGVVRAGHAHALGFLQPYEQQLVDAVAETLSVWLDRIDAITALAEREKRLRGLFDNALDAIVLFDSDGRCVDVNPAMCELSGYRRNELIGESLGLLALDAREVDRLLEDLHRKGRLTRSLRIRDRQGRQHATDLRAVADIVPGLHAQILRDVTEQREAERQLVEDEERLRIALEREQEITDELRRLDQMKNAFLTAVSHELRTPLTGMIGFSQLLRTHRDRMPPEQVDTLLARLEANATRLGTLLAQLLDLDRLSRGALMLDLTTCDVAALVLTTVEGMDLRGRQLGVDVVPAVAHVDGPKVERIIENLVANAIRHTSTETPIWVRLRPENAGAHLTVEDAGAGVPDLLKPRIFEPFEVGASDAAKTGGTGIGLAIVHRFAELHGGRAWVDDRPGGGAAFHVWLPGPSREAATSSP